MCGGGLKGPKSSNRIQLSRFVQSYGIFSDFVVPVVPMLSPSSLLSPHCPRHPHVIPIAPRRSQCSLLGCGLRGLCCLHPMLSPCCPRGPHVIPVVPVSSLSSPCHPHCPHIVPIAPRRSPCGLHGCGLPWSLRCLHPMLSPWSPRRPRVVPVIPTSSRRFPHHP